MSSYLRPPMEAEGDNIRLLCILSNEDEAAPLQCALRVYSLPRLDSRTHLYEALSYAWGNPNETLPICVDGVQFPVTVNLHAALLRLRDRSFERVIWVDAVCINQRDSEERKEQVQLMAKIYSKAHRVIVWLGEEAVDIKGALEDINLAANEELTGSSTKKMNQHAILNLLQRPWFQRIWVLQELAAARHIVMMCGSVEIDGYAFCLGLKSLKLSYTASPELQTLPSVTYLIERAGLRSKYIKNLPQRFSLNIRCLAELIDMFHTRKASDVHDKIYALLGMSSDDPDEAGIQPDYQVSWKELFQKLVKFVLGKDIFVETSEHTQRAVIKSKGSILGQVSLARIDDRQNVNITFTSENAAWCLGNKVEWTLQASAKSIQECDIICLLQGASKPTIIRLCDDHFAIVVIAVTPLEKSGSREYLELSKSITHFPRDFPLVWDWEQLPGEFQNREESKNWVSLEKATRTWNVALILADVKEYEKAEKRLQEAIEGYEVAFGEKNPYKLKSYYGLTPLSWAAGNGYDAIATLLIAKDDIDLDLKDIEYGQTPLSWAAERGHQAVVWLLLNTEKINIDAKDKKNRTPLWWAASEGHGAVVKLLLETGKVDFDSKDAETGLMPLSVAAVGGYETVVKLLLMTGKVKVDAKDKYGRTPLSWAAEEGHEAIVKLLLETGKVKVDAKDKYGRTPLSWAAKEGHEAIVKLLLEIGKVEVDTKDNINRTPLSWAAGEGHEATFKLLLETGKVEVDTKDDSNWTPLFWAARKGNEAIVKLLLETGKVEIDTKDTWGQTPLSCAAEKGHETIVKMLLKTGKVNINTKDKNNRTPLWWAAREGQETIVKLLLETGKVEVDAKDKLGRTPLSRAAEKEHEAIVKLLLETGKVNINTKDKNNRTPLWWAAREGQETIVKLLLETGKAKVDAKDKWGQTPLWWAAREGQETIVKLLLETGKVEVDAKDKWGQTPLSCAAEKGHETIVKLLLETGKVKVDAKDELGNTPLSKAAHNRHGTVVRLLKLSTI